LVQKQNARAQIVQGAIYGLIVMTSLRLIVWLAGEEFYTDFQVLAVLAGLLSYFVFRGVDLTESWQPGKPGALGAQVLMQWLWLVAGLLLIGVVTQSADNFSRRVLLIWFVSVPALLLCVHLLARHGLRRVMPALLTRRTAVIVFANSSARTLGERLLRSSAYDLRGYFDDRDEERTGGGIPGAPLLGKARNAPQYVRDHEIGRAHV
jgi:FlaA1/EpsC-like NDP-sugar epimerase